jgi:hypothetical protein
LQRQQPRAAGGRRRADPKRSLIRGNRVIHRTAFLEDIAQRAPRISVRRFLLDLPLHASCLR